MGPGRQKIMPEQIDAAAAGYFRNVFGDIYSAG